LQVFRISPREIPSLSKGKSGGRVDTFLPPDKVVRLYSAIPPRAEWTVIPQCLSPHSLVFKSRLHLRQVRMRFG